MNVNLTDYLSEGEIRAILVEELRLQVRNHFESEAKARRLLSNLSYEIVREEIEKIVPNYHDELVKRVAAVIKDVNLDSRIFDSDRWSTYSNPSLGWKIIEKTVKENEELIKQRVVDTIQSTDYSEQAWNKLETLAEDFTSNIYEFISALKNTKKE